MKVRILQLFSRITMRAAPLVNRLLATTARRADLAPPTDRATFACRIAGASVLEIGPFYTPVVKGDTVSYFDVLDTAGLRTRGAQLGLDISNVPDIQFVSPVGDLSVVDRLFDTVVSSHAIEHQPDLIHHLQQVSKVLNPGGAYRLFIPDKRYTFDYFLPASTSDEVAEAHDERRCVHTPHSIANHRLGTTHNVPMMHWIGVHGAKRDSPEMQEVAARESEQARRGEYVDVHAWMFTPRSFNEIVSALHRDGTIDLIAEAVHATGFGQLEFFAVLRKPRTPSASARGDNG